MLQARRLIQLVRINPLHEFLKRLFRPPVAVMNRVLDKLAVFPDQAKIDAPCVDADHIEASRKRRLADALLDIVKQAQRIPEKRPVQRNRIIGEAVEFFHCNFSIRILGDHCTAAGSAEIEC